MNRSITQILLDFEVDFDRGFLPSENPILRLNADFESWESIADDFSALLNTQQLRNRLDELQLISTNSLVSKTELERAMLLLSFFGHGYIFSPPVTKNSIPASIAIPWTAVAKKLGRQPIISHASAVLQNWRKLDPKGPIHTDNIACRIQFHGGIDEAWFFLSTVEIEQNGAPALVAILEAMQAIQAEDKDGVQKAMEKIIESFEAVLKGLIKTRDYCDPYIFYNRIRPFLASFEKITYQGCNPKVRSYHGGSAAQSSLIQAFDAAFQIKHNAPEAKYFLTEMQKYMPPKHAAFIHFLTTNVDLVSYCDRFPDLKKLKEQCIELLTAFRNEHLKIVAEYIIKQSNQVGPGQKGTGGTNPLIFLKQVRDDTI